MRGALNDMNGDKASRPAGYTAVFWQSNWETVKGDILNIFKDFHSTSKFVKSLNSTFIVIGAEESRS